MNIIILGAGRTGFSLAQRLIHEDKHVVLIEQDREKADYADSKLDCKVINDSGNNLEVLKLAEAAKAKFFIALTESDEINMIACALVSSEFKDIETVARVRNIEYFNSQILSHRFLGIDHVINPEIEVAKKIVKTIDQGARSEIMSFDNPNYQMWDYTIGKSSYFDKKSIAKVRSDFSEKFLIVSILRDDDYIIPTGASVLLENDQIYILSTKEGFEEIFKKDGKPQRPINSLLLIGGGKTGRYVADALFDNNSEQKSIFRKISTLFKGGNSRSIHFVEEDYKKCKLLAERYPNALVTHADISDEGFLEEEKLDGYDLMVNITGNQELNLISGIYGKKLGVKRVISIVKKSGYKNISKYLDLDVTISKDDSVVGSILKIVRHGDVLSVHTISDSDLEAIEFLVEKSSGVDGKKIMDIKLPKDNLIMLISRDQESFIPTGDTVVSSGDHIVVMSTKWSLKKLEALFSETS